VRREFVQHEGAGIGQKSGEKEAMEKLKNKFPSLFGFKGQPTVDINSFVFYSGCIFSCSRSPEKSLILWRFKND
jgi:hypothetical protein